MNNIKNNNMMMIKKSTGLTLLLLPTAAVGFGVVKPSTKHQSALPVQSTESSSSSLFGKYLFISIVNKQTHAHTIMKE